MKSPFKFPDSYTREDWTVFFGRDQEITELNKKPGGIIIIQVPKERSVQARGLPCASKRTNPMSSKGTVCNNTGNARCPGSKMLYSY